MTRKPRKRTAKSSRAARRPHSLDGVFRPRAVAVIGASARPETIGYQVVANLLAGGFRGPVYPVNRRAKVVHSIPTHASVAAIPGPVDLAVIVVPAEHVLAVAEECGEHGVRGLVVITAGFREIGGDGLTREAELVEIAQRYGMRIIGPNCMGVINTETAVALNASFAATLPPPGHVAMVSQSGALGEAILADATAAGLGVSMFASVGNRADITAADLIEYWERDDAVRVILLYIESLGDPAHFVEVARRVSRTKPIIAVKSGRSAAGAAAAGSHTGAITAGADVAADTLLAQCGVLRVDSFRDMFALAAAVLHQPAPAGPRIAVVTNAGGPGILATDALVGSGLVMADLGKRATAALRRGLPPEASVRNPVDLIASATGATYRTALRAVVRDRGVDGVLVLFVSPVMIDALAVAEAVVDETKGSGKPVLACVMGRQRGNEALAYLTSHGIPVFRYPEDAARTMQLLSRRSALLARPPATFRRRRGAPPKKAATRIAACRDAGGGWMSSADAEAVLVAYGIPFARSRRVAAPGDAVAAAHALGFPVVLKAEADGLVHKSEHRAVRPRLRDGDEVFAAATDLCSRLRRRFPDVSLQVQAQATGHREVLLGMRRDPRYGPLFVAGLGGTHVEVMRDFALRVAPMDDRDPVEMFQSLKGAALLGPFRGEPAARVEVACDALLRIQQLVLDHPDVAELEINPFILDATGDGSVGVDARLRVAGPDEVTVS